MSKIAVIGSGTMGNGIAHVFAQHGHDVSLIDVNAAALEKAKATIAGNLDRQVKKGTLAAEAPAEILARITTGTDLALAATASLVIEAASENPAIKFDIFAEDTRQRTIIDLAFAQELTQAQIARKLELPLGTVKSRLRLAYAHLKKCLEHSP